MGDEPYTAFLPWVVFAVVARVHGDGIAWAAVCAAVTTIALLLTSRRESARRSNVLLRAAFALFTLLGVAALYFNDPADWLTRNGRAVSAFGFTIIAIASLTHTTIAEFYTRPRVRPSRWNTKSFDEMNASLTLIWAVSFALIGVSHLVAAWIATSTAFTTFNWVVPLAIAVVAMHRTRETFDNFVDADDETASPDALWDLSVDWPSGDA